jgi:hypothetical protein
VEEIVEVTVKLTVRGHDQEPEARQDHRGGGERFPARAAGVALLLVTDRPCRLVAEEHPQRLLDCKPDQCAAPESLISCGVKN